MTTSIIKTRYEVTGLPESGSAQGEYLQRNSTGVRVTLDTTVGTGLSSATTYNPPADAKWLVITMPSTNKEPIRFSVTTAEVGIPLSSQGQSVITLTSLTTVFVMYTTSTRAPSGVRLDYF